MNDGPARSKWTHALIAVAAALLLVSCVPKPASAPREGAVLHHEFLAHPDDRTRRVEIFWMRPVGAGPWPAIVFLHGQQDAPRQGGRVFVDWGVLAATAARGYVGIAVSQPGYGDSEGPADFCGPSTQGAVAGVIEHFRSQAFVIPGSVAIEGISHGAVVAALVATHDARLGAIVLISGVYDLSAIPPGPIADAMRREGVVTRQDLDDRSALIAADRIKAATLILNGAKDDLTFPDQARALAARIQAHGTAAKAVIYSEFGHAIPPPVRAKEIDPFLAEHLARARPD